MRALAALLSFSLLCAFNAAGQPAFSNSEQTEGSVEYPIYVHASDSFIRAELIRYAEQAFAHASAYLKLEPPADTLFLYEWKSSSSENNAFSQGDLQLSFQVDGLLKKFKIIGSGSIAQKGEDIYRKTLSSVLQAQMLAHADTDEDLPTPSLWLVEGLTQNRLTSTQEGQEQAVKRLAMLKQVPTLAEIGQWKSLSPHYLEKLSQQAFCGYLVKQACGDSLQRPRLHAWVAGGCKAHPFWDNTHEAWWQDCLQKPMTRVFPIVDFQQTEKDLAQTLDLNKRLSKKASDSTTKLLHLTKEDSLSQDVIRKTAAKLMELELEAHFLWRPVIGEYAHALALWQKKEYTAYSLQAEKAEAQRQKLIKLHERVNTYLDWFEVHQLTHPQPIDLSEFEKLESFEFEGKRDDPIFLRLQKAEEDSAYFSR